MFKLKLISFLVLSQLLILGCGDGFEAQKSEFLSQASANAPRIAAPLLTSGLSDLTSNAGASLSAGQFCITASGEGLNYSWLKDGATAPYNDNKRCYLISNPTEMDSGTYTVIATNSAGSVTSMGKLDIVGPPTLTKQLSALSVNVGQALTAGQFCIAAMGKNLQYLWKKDGMTAPYNANKPCYLVSAVAESDAGNYTVEVSNSAGNVSSSTALTVIAPPVLTKMLGNLTVSAGSSLVAGQFCVSVTGTGLSYACGARTEVPHLIMRTSPATWLHPFKRPTQARIQLKFPMQPERLLLLVRSQFLV